MLRNAIAWYMLQNTAVDMSFLKIKLNWAAP